MTKEEFAAVRAEMLSRIDNAIREGMRVLEETKRQLEDLALERRATESAFDAIKDYLIG